MGKGKSPACWERDPGRNSAAGNSFHIAYRSSVEEDTCPGFQFGAPLTSNRHHVHATEQKLQTMLEQQKHLQLLLVLHLTNSHVFLKQLYIPTFINKHLQQMGSILLCTLLAV